MDLSSSLGQTVGRRDAEAFAAIFEAYHLPICRYLCRLVGDVDLAEDLAQDTFVKAFKALSQGQPESPKAWLYAIATNTAISALRRRRLIAWLPVHGDREAEGKVADRDPVAAFGENELLVQALRKLRKDDAACLLLHFQQGLGCDELAAVFGVSIPAAKMRLSRARAAFREAYQRLDQETSP